MEKEPFGFHGPNLYWYGRANAMNGWDPNGLNWWPPHKWHVGVKAGCYIVGMGTIGVLTGGAGALVIGVGAAALEGGAYLHNIASNPTPEAVIESGPALAGSIMGVGQALPTGARGGHSVSGPAPRPAPDMPDTGVGVGYNRDCH
jgi:hypothetical protein